jgi:hypothetical protein
VMAGRQGSPLGSGPGGSGSSFGNAQTPTSRGQGRNGSATSGPRNGPPSASGPGGATRRGGSSGR